MPRSRTTSRIPIEPIEVDSLDAASMLARCADTLKNIPFTDLPYAQTGRGPRRYLVRHLREFAEREVAHAIARRQPELIHG